MDAPMTIVATTVVMVSIFVIAFLLHMRAFFRLRRSLTREHPDEWVRLITDIGQGRQSPVQAFAWSGRHQELGDLTLTDAVRGYRIWGITAAAALLAAPFAWMPVEALQSLLGLTA
jgi:hypothetical protein